MNADVEKAVDVLTDHIADLNRCIGAFLAYPERKPIAAEFEKATKELALVAKALCDQEAEIADLKADRDSWADQASDRVKDWDDMRQRAEKAEALLRECRDLFRPKPYSGIYEVISLMGRITAHLGGEHE